jgi:hypothetical protein
MPTQSISPGSMVESVVGGGESVVVGAVVVVVGAGASGVVEVPGSGRVVVELAVGSTLDVVDDGGKVGFVIGAPTVVPVASSSPLHPVAVSSSVASMATARLVIAVW